MESFLSFHLNMGLRDQTQGVRLTWEAPLPTEPPHQSELGVRWWTTQQLERECLFKGKECGVRDVPKPWAQQLTTAIKQCAIWVSPGLSFLTTEMRTLLPIFEDGWSDGWEQSLKAITSQHSLRQSVITIVAFSMMLLAKWAQFFSVFVHLLTPTQILSLLLSCKTRVTVHKSSGLSILFVQENFFYNSGESCASPFISKSFRHCRLLVVLNLLVYTIISTCVCSCACIWVFVCACVYEAKDGYRLSSPIAPHLVFETDSLTEPGTFWFG